MPEVKQQAGDLASAPTCPGHLVDGELAAASPRLRVI